MRTLPIHMDHQALAAICERHGIETLSLFGSILREDFRPEPDGFIAQRARQVLGETIELLERIADEPGKAPLLEAIADGTFGLMKRPADRGKGLEGVAQRAPGYVNPAIDLLEEGSAR